MVLAPSALTRNQRAAAHLEYTTLCIGGQRFKHRCMPFVLRQHRGEEHSAASPQVSLHLSIQPPIVKRLGYSLALGAVRIGRVGTRAADPGLAVVRSCCCQHP